MNIRYGLISLIFFVLLFLPTHFLAQTAIEVEFTAEELLWLKEHPVIRVANEQDWPPFDFNEDGTPKGLVIDHIKLLAKKAGLQLEFVHGRPWGELVDLFREKKIDVMPVFYMNDERKPFTLYTKSYHEGRLGVFVNSDHKTNSSLFVNKRVGMETSHGSIPLVKKRYPGVEITEVDEKVELVRQLATGKLDMIIGNPFVFYYHAKENQLNNIKLASFIRLYGEEVRNVSFHIGVRKDWPMLHQIIEKCMANVSDEEMETLKKQWADIDIVQPVDWALVIQVCLVIVFLVLFLMWHNRKLYLIVSKKTAELRLLNEMLESKVEERTLELTQVNEELHQSLDELKTLKGIIPICASCKKIRDDSGYWNQLEEYITQHSLAEFSHGICPGCTQKLYPDMSDEEDTDV